MLKLKASSKTVAVYEDIYVECSAPRFAPYNGDYMGDVFARDILLSSCFGDNRYENMEDLYLEQAM